ncbi:MAG: F0F1 ATP synthase subunit A [Erysipelotrichaceae bacterium]
MDNPINGLLFIINGKEYILQQAALVWVALCVLLGIFFVVAGRRIEKADEKKAPKGIVLFAEIIHGLANTIIKGNLNKRTAKYLPLFGTLIFMMAMSNLVGLFGFQPPTSNLGINVTLAVCLWLLIQGTALSEKGGLGRLKELMDPHWLLFPLNLIGELVLPLSLSMRLFGNMLSGTIIMMLVYGIFTMLANIFAPLGAIIFVATPFLHMYFDIFSGLIQTYVFYMIASFFLGATFNEE